MKPGKYWPMALAGTLLTLMAGGVTTTLAVGTLAVTADVTRATS